jgi:serine/threonine protein phosphatase PrpC
MLEIGTALDVGLKRKDHENQDSLRVVQPTLFNRKPPLLIVADGMGGYMGGATASKTVVDVMEREYQKARKDTSMIDVLYNAVLSAHRKIHDLAQQKPELGLMGSTVVAAVIDGDMLYLVNVGDSRAYLINPQRIQQINWDHSLLADEIRNKRLTLEEARDYPHKNVLTMSLSAQRNEIEPFTMQHRLENNEHLLLCSDGLWGVVTEAQIQAVVLQFPAQRAADKLVQMANANQGPDNISIIIARRSDHFTFGDQDTQRLMSQ